MMIDQNSLHPAWRERFSGPDIANALVDIGAQLARERAGRIIHYPPVRDVFRAFSFCGPAEVRVVIVGQDPYHGPDQAMGLSFSVRTGLKLPPSLRNIFQEIDRDCGGLAGDRVDGDLTRWARQGVMLLNTALTVRAGEAGSHAGLGWQTITDAALAEISHAAPACVFMLWGRHAAAKASLVDRARHLILEAPHPSPLSAHRGFFGCSHFSQANAWLEERNLPPIRW